MSEPRDRTAGQADGGAPEGDTAYSVNDLADAAGVTRRTVHYYIAQGLLPASGGEGRSSRYGRSHLDRLRLIRELQREHLPLAEIRQRLERLTGAQVADLLKIGQHIAEPRGTAFEYIQSLLGSSSVRAIAAPVAPARPPLRAAVTAPAAAPIPQAAGTTAPRATPGAPPSEPGDHSARAVREPAVQYTSEPPSAIARSQWERIALAPDIELHIRRPLSRIQNRAVDRLVGLARQLLEEDRP